VKARVTMDRTSLLAIVEAAATLGAIEDELAKESLTLGLAPGTPRDITLGKWLDDGAVGAPDPWSDPADHLVAGLEAVLHDGLRLDVRPAPRRAVGPDLIALVVGMRGRFAKVERAWLRVHRLDARRATTHPFEGPRNPPVSPGETTLIDAIAHELLRS
jgi:alkyldihydroxyacetonephosphate synthase